MIIDRIIQLLLLISSVTSQVLAMMPVDKVSNMPFQVEGIAQKIEELPKELKYKILSSTLALLENQKYEVYKRLDVGSAVRVIALNADNTKVLVGLEGGVVRLWDVENGKILKELKGHANDITSMALNADRTLALTGSWDGTARVWDMNTGELIRIFEVGSAVHSVALRADGALALTGGVDKIARLYNVSTGELLKELKGHGVGITSVALSANGSIALTGSYDKTVRIWNTFTGELIRAFEVESDVSSVALSADGTLALTVTIDAEVLVLDVNSGTLLNTLLPKSMYIYALALSKDGKTALTDTNEGTIQVWNTKPLPGKKEITTPLTVLAGHTGRVRTVAFGGADFIASGSDDKNVIIWRPYALEPRGPQEHEEVLWQAYKEIFSKPKFLFPNETKQA